MVWSSLYKRKRRGEGKNKRAIFFFFETLMKTHLITFILIKSVFQLLLSTGNHFLEWLWSLPLCKIGNWKLRMRKWHCFLWQKREPQFISFNVTIFSHYNNSIYTLQKIENGQKLKIAYNPTTWSYTGVPLYFHMHMFLKQSWDSSIYAELHLHFLIQYYKKSIFSSH